MKTILFLSLSLALVACGGGSGGSSSGSDPEDPGNPDPTNPTTPTDPSEPSGPSVTSVPGHQWHNAFRISSGTTIYSGNPSVATDGNTSLVAWLESTDGELKVKATVFSGDLPESQHSVDALSVQTINVETSSADSSIWVHDDNWNGKKKYGKESVSAAISGNQAYLAWSEGGKLMAATYSAELASWSVSDLGLSDAAYQHAMTDEGELVVVAGGGLYVARYDIATAGWIVSDALDVGLLAEASFAFVRKDGAIHITYVKNGGQGSQLKVATTDSASLLASISIVSDTEAMKLAPAMISYGEGFYVAWRQRLGGNDTGLVFAMSNGDEWDATLVSEASASEVALVASGNGAKLLWVDDNSKNNTALYSAQLAGTQYQGVRTIAEFGVQQPIVESVEGGITLLYGRNVGSSLEPVSYSDAEDAWGIGEQICIPKQTGGVSGCLNGINDFDFDMAEGKGVVSWLAGSEVYVAISKN